MARKKNTINSAVSLQTFDNIPIGILIYQFIQPDKLSLIYGNPAAENLTGVKIADNVGKEFDAIWPNANESGITEAFLNVVITGQTLRQDDLHYEDDNLEGAFSVIAFQLPNNRLAVSFENITERKKAEIDIQRQTKNLKTLFEISKDYITTLNLQSLFQRITDSLIEISGLGSAAIYLIETNQIYLGGTSPALPDEFPEHLRWASLENHPHIEKCVISQEQMVISDTHKEKLSEAEQEVCEMRDLRSILYLPMIIGVEVIGVLIIASVGKIHRFDEELISMCNTISNLSALAVQNAQLFSKLNQNSLELEKEVEKRTKDLEIKNKELESFTYSVSHDLKAPLRGIDGYSRLLQKNYYDKLDDEGLEFLANIRQSTKEMHQLIEDLLAYSRIEKHKLSLREIDIEWIIQSLLSEFSPLIEETQAEIIIKVQQEHIYTDYEAFSQALRNIIDNALKFKKNDTNLIIEIVGIVNNDNYLLSIQDNGIGFEMRYYDKIFEIFQRLHRADEYPGTGIGLAIVAKAMERLHGRVWGDSEPGKGSVFYLELPRRL